jgi:ABC-type Fe3+-hydroxamate transport system substrate-binding protein
LRIVSLVPSLTELVCELGLAPYLVGRTGFCIHPQELVRSIPKVGGTKDINLQKIRALAPTHVILNRDENRLEDATALKAFVPNVVITHPLTATDNLALYAQFGEVFSCQEKAQKLAEQFSAELAANRNAHWPTLAVLYLIWRKPWMTVSPPTYIASMLAEVGLRVVGPWQEGAAENEKRYPELSESQAVACNPKAILFSSEPYSFTPADFVATTQWAPPSVPRLMVDGEMLSWYGPKAIAGLRYLREFRKALIVSEKHYG